MENKILTSVKIEQPEVYIDYPGEDIRNMVSHSWFPSNSIKLESVCEVDNVQNSAREIISEGQTFDKMDCKIPICVKTEQSEAYANSPCEDKTKISMGLHSWLPSNSIQLELTCEADNVETSATQIISEGQTFDMMHIKIPAGVKIEQSKVYIDYPGEDEKIHPCSQRCSSLQGQSQMEKEMVFGNIDWKLVKQESSDALFEDKSHRLYTMVGMASCCRIPEMVADNNTESKMSEVDTASVVHHQEVSFIGNGYKISQREEYCSNTSDIVSTVIENNTKICLVNKNYQLQNVESQVKHTTISGKSLNYTVGCTSCSPQRIQTGDTPHMSNGSDVSMNVDTFLHRQKTRDAREKPFTEAGYLKGYKRNNAGEKPHKCDICAANFSQTSHLKRHMRTHTGEKPYKCDMCGASFTQDGSLKYHMRTHTGEKPYECNVCAASFTHAGSLKCHMRATHTGERPYKCDICAVSFTTASVLTCHKRIHTGEKPYRCDVCGLTFTTTSQLKCHMRTHTGEKPFKCNICAGSFAQVGSLKCHMRSHTGEKPFKCNICAASFAHAGSLNCHIKVTHTAERPYKCDICSVSFTTASILKYHIGTHRRENIQV